MAAPVVWIGNEVFSVADYVRVFVRAETVAHEVRWFQSNPMPAEEAAERALRWREVGYEVRVDYVPPDERS